MLLVVAGCCWVLLVIAGWCSLLLVVAAAVAGCFSAWLLLAVADIAVVFCLVFAVVVFSALLLVAVVAVVAAVAVVFSALLLNSGSLQRWWQIVAISLFLVGCFWMSLVILWLLFLIGWFWLCKCECAAMQGLCMFGSEPTD